jgi:hypothetical protein
VRYQPRNCFSAVADKLVKSALALKSRVFRTLAPTISCEAISTCLALVLKRISDAL